MSSKKISPPICYVISHERSGTHFTIDTVARNFPAYRQLHNVGEWFGPYAEPESRFAHIRQATENFSGWSGLVKSHVDYACFARSFPRAPVVYVVRDPRDTMVSWWHYLNNNSYYRYNPQVPYQGAVTISEFLRRPISPFLKNSYSLHGEFNNVVERWCAHIRGWLAAEEKPLVVHYEDLYFDFANTVSRLGKFLQQPLPGNLERPTLADGSGHFKRVGTPNDWVNWLSRDDNDFILSVVRQAGLEETLDHLSPAGASTPAGTAPQDRADSTPARSRTRKKAAPADTGPAAPKSILFIRPDSYGDVILFEPVLRLLAEQWPETKIGLLAQAGRSDLAPLLPPNIHWFPLACNPHRVGSQSESTLQVLAALKTQIENFAPECVVAACYDKTWVEAAVAAMVPRARRVSVGHYNLRPLDAFDVESAYGRPLSSWFDEIVAVEESEPELDKHRKLLVYLTGKPVATFVPTVVTPDSFRTSARRHLGELGLSPGRYFICCPAGNANVSIKSWPAAKYGELIARLAAEQGWAPLLTGHVSERPILEAVATAASEAGCQSVRIWAGNDGEIGLLAGLIADACYYVGNDTGSMHLAAALGVRVVGVFGGGTWPRFRPAAPHAVCVVHPLPCFPCGWSCHFGDAPCLHRISVAEVEKAVKAVLQGEPGCRDQVVTNAFSADEKGLIESVVRRQKSLSPEGSAAGEQTVPAARVRELLNAFRHSEQDRAARLEVIHQQGRAHSALEAAHDACLQELAAARGHLAAAETDRAARLEVIEQQAQRHSALEAEHDARLKELTALYATAEALRNERDFIKLQLAEIQGHFTTSESDRVTRIKELTALYETAEVLKNERNLLKLQLAEIQGHFTTAEADRVARIKELTALYETAEVLKNERNLLKLQLAEIQGHLTAAQADRAARLAAIEQQAQKHSALEAEHDVRLKELTALYATAEALRNERDLGKLQFAELKGHFNSSEADRAARLAVIERQGQAYSALEAEHDRRLKELTALYVTVEALRNERDSLQAQLAAKQVTPQKSAGPR